MRQYESWGRNIETDHFQGKPNNVLHFYKDIFLQYATTLLVVYNAKLCSNQFLMYAIDSWVITDQLCRNWKWSQWIVKGTARYDRIGNYIVGEYKVEIERRIQCIHQQRFQCFVHCLKPVSYTHLDVYKRQLTYFSI